MEEGKRKAVLAHLDGLVGEWETEATHPYLPGAVIRGRATFEWLDGGHFLIWRASNDHPDVPNSIAVIGCDEAGASQPRDHDGQPARGCAMHYFDSRGVSRVYRVEAEPGVWRFWRDSPDLSQCFVNTIGADGNTITSNGEMSKDGVSWEQDLRVTYRRVG